MYKRVDGYHSNKRKKSVYFDTGLCERHIKGCERLYGMEIELDFPDVRDVDCERCDGSGNCDVEVDCPQCGGSGTIEQENSETGELTESRCEHCNGSGITYILDDCPDCNGSGSVTVEYDFSDLQYLPDNLANTCVFESDGSLDCGFEVITEPMTYNGILEWLDNDWLRNALNESCDKDTAGVHIHVSRPDIEMIKKIIIFMAKTGERLGDLTRDSSYASYYPYEWQNTDSKSFKELVAYLVNLDYDPYGDWYDYRPSGFSGHIFYSMHEYFGERYMALNLQNESTIEFRFFNYTNSPRRLKTYIQFLELMFDILESMTFEQVVKSEFRVQSLTDISFEDSDKWYNCFEVKRTIHDMSQMVFSKVNSLFDTGYYGSFDEYRRRNAYMDYIDDGMVVRFDPFLLKMNKRLRELGNNPEYSDLGHVYTLINEHRVELDEHIYEHILKGGLFVIKNAWSSIVDVVPVYESNVCLSDAKEVYTLDKRWIKQVYNVPEIDEVKVYKIFKESEEI